MTFISNSIIFFIFGLFFGSIWEGSESMKLQGDSSDNFQLICNVTFEVGNIPVLKYRSRRTGLQIYVAQVEGPIVEAIFTLATEAHDDDGLPHTLEHLIFKGSKKYPYTSALDLLANLNVAGGTNAYTARDHTAYLINTAGKEGILNMLPIYLDHILHPLLMNESYVTEVYHITKDGDDAGVVYSEMQGRENKMGSLMYNAKQRILYPEPCGYRYETGGLMKNLRESTTYEKIKNYHEKFYRPEFLSLTFTGMIDANEIFEALESTENDIEQEKRPPASTRPWSSRPPPFTKSKELDVKFPSQTEETCGVYFAWRGPTTDDFLEIQSLDILLDYLTSLSISPINKAFTEDTSLATSVFGTVEEYASSSILIGLSGISLKNISDIKPHFLKTMRNISEHPDKFDMGLVKLLLHSAIVDEDNSPVRYSHDILQSYINMDILHGNSCEYLDSVLNQKKHYKELMEKDASFWMNLFNKYFTDTPMAVIRGIPSISESKKIKNETKARITKRKIELGEEELERLGKVVDEAKKMNDIPLPIKFLESNPSPSTMKLHFHNMTPYTNIENHESGIISPKVPSVIDLKSIPFKLSIDDIPSKSVVIRAVLDHSDLTPSEYPYLPLLTSLLLSSPIRKNCELISAEEVIRQINTDLTNSYISSGVNMNTISIILDAELKKFPKAVEWLGDILYRVEFVRSRVLLKTKQLLITYKRSKQSGSGRLGLIISDLLFRNDTPAVNNFLRQEEFYKKLKDDLDNNSTDVFDKLKEIYQKMTSISKLSIHMATDVERLDAVRDIESTWKGFAGNSDMCLKDYRLKDLENWRSLSDFSKTTGKAIVHGMTSLESSTLKQITKGIKSYSDCDIPALYTAIKYFTQTEGPLWKGVRGNGLAYGYRISNDVSSGMLSLSLNRASQLTKAYRVATDIIKSHLNGTTKWDHYQLEAAKSALIYGLAATESEISDLAGLSMLAYYRKIPHTHNRELIKKVKAVTMNEAKAMAQKYLRKLIDPHDSALVTVCPSNKVDETIKELNRMNFEVENIEDIEKSRFA